jgi:hypothetical protein
MVSDGEVFVITFVFVPVRHGECRWKSEGVFPP